MGLEPFWYNSGYVRVQSCIFKLRTYFQLLQWLRVRLCKQAGWEFQSQLETTLVVRVEVVTRVIQYKSFISNQASSPLMLLVTIFLKCTIRPEQKKKGPSQDDKRA